MNLNLLLSKKTLLLYKELFEYLKDAKIKLANSSTIEQFKILEDMYQKVKEYSVYFYKNNNFSFFYKKILDILVECESKVNGIQYSSNSQNYKIDSFLDVYSIDTLLDFITTNVRNRIIKDYTNYTNNVLNINNSINIDQINLTNMCEIISHYVKEECSRFGIKCDIIKISPAFNEDANIYGDNSGYHFFNVLECQGNRYLMDLSYSQFFKQDSDNMLTKLGVPYLKPCNPGIYMLSNKERCKVANDILSRGWVPFTESNVKKYFDGFVLSFRNGLYYELLGKVDYNTDYDYDDYFNFLIGCDDLFRYEPKEGIGYQRRPLKNPNINFKIK